jgi:hypothetical protein
VPKAGAKSTTLARPGTGRTVPASTSLPDWSLALAPASRWSCVLFLERCPLTECKGVLLFPPEGADSSTTPAPIASPKERAGRSVGDLCTDSFPEGESAEAKGCAIHGLESRSASDRSRRWCCPACEPFLLNLASSKLAVWCLGWIRQSGVSKRPYPQFVDPKVSRPGLRGDSTQSEWLTRILVSLGVTTSRLPERRGGERQHLLLYFASINLHSPVRHQRCAVSPEGGVAQHLARPPQGSCERRTMPPTPRATEAAVGAARRVNPSSSTSPRASSRCGALDGFARAAYRKRSP